MSFSKLLLIFSARRKLFVFSFLSLFLIIIAVTLFKDKEYTSEISFVIDTDRVDPVTNLPVNGQLVSQYLATQVGILTSHDNALTVVKKLELNKIPQIQEKFSEQEGFGDIDDWLANFLLKNTEISISKEANIVSLKFTSTDPQFASLVAKTFVSSYKEMIISIKSELAKQNKSFYGSQLVSLQEDFQRAQQKYSEFQKEQQILVEDNKIDIEVQKLADLTAQMINAKSSMINALTKTKTDSAIQVDIVNNPLIQQLKSQVATLDAQLHFIATKNGVNHPAYKEALANLSSAKAQLQKQELMYNNTLKSTYESEKARFDELSNSVQKQKELILNLNTLNDKLAILKRDVDNKDKVYNLALQKFSEYAMQSMVNSTNVSIIKDAPIPNKPSKPNLLVNGILGFILSFIFSFGLTLFVESRKGIIRIKSDISAFKSHNVIDFSE